MLRTLKSLLAAIALLAAPAVAHAEEATKAYPDCGREPTDAEVAAAKGAFQAGNASFNEADYARAIDYWEDAYRRDCTANPLLLNLARAYELAGRKRQAVVSLETFLAREPSSGEKDQITRRIEVLRKKIAEEDAAAAAALPPTNGTPTGPSTAPTDGVAPSDAEPRTSRSAWPWIVVGVGGAATIVGTVLIIKNNGDLNDATERCGPGGRANCPDESARNDGNAARSGLNVSVAVTAVGVGALAGGIVWAVLDGKRVARQNASGVSTLRTALVPMVSPELAGLSWSGAF